MRSYVALLIEKEKHQESISLKPKLGPIGSLKSLERRDIIYSMHYWNKNRPIVIIAIWLMAGLYFATCLMIFDATRGVKNGIDDSDGLPLVWDIILIISSCLIFCTSAALTKIIYSWKLPSSIDKRKKSIWDSKPKNVTPKGPPASKSVD